MQVQKRIMILFPKLNQIHDCRYQKVIRQNPNIPTGEINVLKPNCITWVSSRIWIKHKPIKVKQLSIKFTAISKQMQESLIQQLSRLNNGSFKKTWSLILYTFYLSSDLWPSFDSVWNREVSKFVVSLNILCAVSL